MALDWSKNPDLGNIEGMTSVQFAEHVRRQTSRISGAIMARKYEEADRLSLALTMDAVTWKRNLGADIENAGRYDLGDLGDWMQQPGLPE